jgi:hypothetical protein
MDQNQLERTLELVNLLLFGVATTKFCRFNFTFDYKESGRHGSDLNKSSLTFAERVRKFVKKYFLEGI